MITTETKKQNEKKSASQNGNLNSKITKNV